MTVKKYSLKKSGNLHLSPHFTVKEFACHDGSDTVLIDDRLVTLLEKIRDRFGKPIHINSAYRTAKYNAKIGGVSNSYHVKGMAADIVAQGVPSKRIAQYAETLDCGGIGWYEQKKFVHIDTRKKRVCWKNSGSNVRKTFSDCPYAEPSKTLQFGDAGAAWIQWHLKKCGAKITIDGKFGAVTKAAVIAFQKAHGLTPDGIVGEKTRLMLKREVV
jgi:peptidoglycan hydrolase-like protein with peptidoglycan-binding domain